ncbi:MAG: DUF3310 domain-containing protein [Sulfurimonas sp.]|nr:DUF3310 domain-containing protein [Sulfurimonas sp.]
MQNQAFQSLPIYTHTEDVVNNPNHYKLFPEMEVIDLIRKTLTTEQFAGYCMGNMLKYKLRAGEKDDVTQDLAKAEKYKEWLYDEH